MNITLEVKIPQELTRAILALAETMALLVDKQKGVELIDQHIAEEEKVTIAAPKAADTPPQEEAPKVTLEGVRAAFVAKNSKDNTSKLKSILNDFGVEKVTDLEEKDFSGVLKALEAI